MNYDRESWSHSQNSNNPQVEKKSTTLKTILTEQNYGFKPIYLILGRICLHTSPQTLCPIVSFLTKGNGLWMSRDPSCLIHACALTGLGTLNKFFKLYELQQLWNMKNWVKWPPRHQSAKSSNPKIILICKVLCN